MARSQTHIIAERKAEFCSAFIDPTRVLILYALNEKPRRVGELAEMLDVSQPTMSRHLKILREHALVTTVRQGTMVEYHLADQRLIHALDQLWLVMWTQMNERMPPTHG